VTVIFKQKSRDEFKFNSFEELKSQIKNDVEKSQEYFRSIGFLS